MNTRPWIFVAAVAVLTGCGLTPLEERRLYPRTSAAATAPAAAAPTSFAVKPISRAELGQYLTAQKGKVVIVDFWATWCPPCRAEIPSFIAMQNKFGAHGLQIVGLSLDEGPIAEVEKFYADNKMNYPVFIADMEITNEPRWGGIEGIPTTVILDKSGKIVARHVGSEEQTTFEKEIEPLLK